MDTISRQAAIDLINDIDLINFTAKGVIRDRLRKLPSAQPERKKGKWGNHGECPFCSYLRQWEDDKFCGNCGADMRGEQE